MWGHTLPWVQDGTALGLYGPRTVRVLEDGTGLLAGLYVLVDDTCLDHAVLAENTIVL